MISGLTLASFGWWWYQKGKNDPSFLTEDVTRKGGRIYDNILRVQWIHPTRDLGGK